MNLRHLKRWWRSAVPVLIAGGIIFYYMRGGAAQAKYLTGAASRGPGAIGDPVTTVQVGSYDSRPITAIYADFNAAVKAGERVAKIDPRPCQVKGNEAAAALANARRSDRCVALRVTISARLANSS